MQGTGSPDLRGREDELGAVRELLHDDRPGLRVLLLDGETGIGRTTLWSAGVALTRQMGWHVLRVRAAPSDEMLAFAGLADLLADLPDGLSLQLPPPQQRAIAAVRLEAEPAGVVEPRTIGTALVTMLQSLAGAQPVLVAVDDLPWLDASTASALAFAVRRIEAHRVRLLLTGPDRGARGPVLEALDDLPGAAVHHHTVTALDDASMRGVVGAVGTHPLPRSLVERIVGAAAGHPLLAVELARSVHAMGSRPGPDDPLPLGARLRDLVAARLAALPAEDRDLLRQVAFMARPTVEVVLGLPGGPPALRRWEDAELVAVDRGVVRLTHPLLAIALRDGATMAQRRAAHAALAQRVEDGEERARHLALANPRPDPRVADALERAAERAAGRGSPGAGVELAALAVARTSDGQVRDLARRQLALAALRFRVGDTTAAAELANEVLRSGAHLRQQAEALLILAEIEHEQGNSEAAAAHCSRGLDLVEDDPPMRARMHARMALVASHDLRQAEGHADLSLAVLAELDEPDLATESLALQGKVMAHLGLGHGLLRELAERAVLLEGKAPAPRVADRASAAMVAWLAWIDDVHGAREALDQTLQTAVDEGDESSVPYALSQLPMLQVRLGELAAARATCEKLLEVSTATGQEFQRSQALWMLALVQAHLGELDLATTLAQESRRIAVAGDDPWVVRQTLVVQGFVELSRGRAGAGLDPLRQAVAHERQIRLGNPVMRRGALLLAEALVEVGEVGQASELIEELTAAAVAMDTPPSRAACARLGAQLAAAQGRLTEAAALLQEAHVQHDRLPLPFDVARTWLVAGQVERRLRRRRAAAAAFAQAREGFAAIGAQVWADRAAAEGAGLAAPPVGPLTPGERRVAEALVAGMTVRQVAATLHMSPKTVEVHITRIYRKLGIRTRAELGRVMTAAAPA